MAGVKLDTAGLNKMKVLDDATIQLQRIHGIVEQYAMALKREQPTSTYSMNLRRQLPTLSENLKSYFGMIADQVMSLNLASTRGSSEQVKVRTLREGVAQIRQSIEIAIVQTKDKHAIAEDSEESGTRSAEP
ncbi:MAG TPA: hypothetical protein VFJ20_05275 [Gemmatimonadaceae bacterium]|nr:hypothetical protein [Gemmatimonadaceae bacterium]